MMGCRVRCVAIYASNATRLLKFGRGLHSERHSASILFSKSAGATGQMATTNQTHLITAPGPGYAG